MTSGTLSVKVNDSMGSYFKYGKGVRQGDPLSPHLFNIAVDTLSKMIALAQSNKFITGLIPEYILVVSGYADDTILCLEDDLEKAKNMKYLLYLLRACRV